MYKIIPQVRKATMKDGFLSLNKYSTIKDNSEFKKAIKYLSNVTKLNIKDNGIIEFIKDEKLAYEEYKLDIDNNILIYASSERGALNAVFTFLEIVSNDALKDGIVNEEIEKSLIEDEPKFKVRSFMIDSCRHFFSKDIILRKIDEMARLKFNEFHFHISDDQGFRVLIDKYPKIGEISTKRKCSKTHGMVSFNKKFDNIEYSGYYTKDDIKEICEYANERCVHVVPEIDVPGHFMAVLAAYPEYHCFNKCDVWCDTGVSKEVLCIGNDKSIDFVYDIICEVVKMFKADEVHIGGDECPTYNFEHCDKCKALMKSLGIKDPKKFQGYFTEELSKRLIKDGLKVRIWNEAISDNIDKDIVIQYWNTSNDKPIFERLRNGNKLISSPFDRFYADYTYKWFNLKLTYNFDPLYGKKLEEEYKGNVLGVEIPLWTEWISTEDKMNFQFYPRAMAVAEVGWGTNNDYYDFIHRLDSMDKRLDYLGIYHSPKEYYSKEYPERSLIGKGWDLLTCKEFISEIEYKKYRGKYDKK